MTHPANRMANVRRRVNRARNFPVNTCGASRHLHIIADALSSGRPYPMLEEEPEHCAGSMYSVLESLWKARTQIQRWAAKHPDLAAEEKRRGERLKARIALTLQGKGWVAA